MENKRKQEPSYGLAVNTFTGQQRRFVCGEQGQKGFWKNLTRWVKLPQQVPIKLGSNFKGTTRKMLQLQMEERDPVTIK